MKVQGKIKLIGKTETFGKNGFRKRELVVTTSEQYPQDILIEFVQDKTELLDKFKVGQDVEVSINLRGREWTNPQGEVKYFNSIQGWRIDTAQVEVQVEAQETTFETVEETTDEEFEDGLPF